MALCRSHLFSAIINSIGNVTYQQGRHCSIIARNRPNKIQEWTELQLLNQDRMRSAINDWQKLTNDQREAWRKYSLTITRDNALGDSITLTPSTLYVGTRLAALENNPALDTHTWDDPPCGPFSPPAFTVTVLSQPGDKDVALQIYNQTPDSDIIVTGWLSLPLTFTINYFIGPYDSTKTQTSDVIAIGGSKTLKFSDLTKGYRYHWRLRALTHPGYMSYSRYYHCFTDLPDV